MKTFWGHDSHWSQKEARLVGLITHGFCVYHFSIDRWVSPFVSLRLKACGIFKAQSTSFTLAPPLPWKESNQSQLLQGVFISAHRIPRGSEHMYSGAITRPQQPLTNTLSTWFLPCTMPGLWDPHKVKLWSITQTFHGIKAVWCR